MSPKNRRIGKWLTIPVQKDFDSNLASFHLKEQVLEEIARGSVFIVLDCSQVKSANTQFISRVLLLKNLAKNHNGDLCVIKSSFIKELFRKTKVEEVIKSFDSYSEFKKSVLAEKGQ